jgi:Excalibur calcium-binding domain
VKNLLIIALIGALAWFGYDKYKATRSPTVIEFSGSTSASSLSAAPSSGSSQFSCDGRTHCSQMRSCAEATYFIQHCPNTKMDGNKDGVPCERQWCNQ